MDDAVVEAKEVETFAAQSVGKTMVLLLAARLAKKLRLKLYRSPMRTDKSCGVETASHPYPGHASRMI